MYFVSVVNKWLPLLKFQPSYIQKEKQYTSNTKTQNTQNRKQRTNRDKNIKSILKKQNKAVTNLLTVQERRDKCQQYQTEYSAVHGASCLAAKQMLKCVLPLKATNNVDAASSCFSVLCVLISSCNSAEE